MHIGRKTFRKFLFPFRFDEMIAAIREETVRLVLTVPVKVERPIQREQVLQPDAPNAGSKTPFRSEKKVGRNDPCPCGSGKKYKNCCGKNEQSED